jgi:tetrahydromethanopterin S-methyltransferase subunit E
MTIGWSFQVKKLGERDWGWLLMTGILGGLFAFIVLWNPVFAGLTIAIYAAFAFIVNGVFQVLLAFCLRRLRCKNPAHHETVNVSGNVVSTVNCLTRQRENEV